MRATIRMLATACKCFAVSGYVFLCAVPLCMTATDLWAEERPVIQVNFRFDGPAFSVLQETEQKTIKSRAEKVVGEMGEDSWGFLNWTEESAVQAEAAPTSLVNTAAWNVTLKVEFRQIDGDSGGTVLATIGTLSHVGQLGASQFVFNQTPENETIYPIGQLIPFDHPAAIGDDIEKQLRKQLPVLMANTEVARYFENIPIVNRVIADAAKTRVLVPLKSSELRTDVDSILRVKFNYSSDTSHTVGHFDLKTASVVPEGDQYGGFVHAQVRELSLPLVNIQTPTWWDPELLSIINSAHDVNVYMQTYSASLTPDSVVGDGLIADPGQ